MKEIYLIMECLEAVGQQEKWFPIYAIKDFKNALKELRRLEIEEMKRISDEKFHMEARFRFEPINLYDE